MPPPGPTGPSPPVGGGAAGSVPSPSSLLSAPDSANARVLLRSLEDLRDALSARVDQLTVAVERLRGQASELDRAVSAGSPLTPGFGRPTTVGSFDNIGPLLLPRPYVSVPPRRRSVIPRSNATPGPDRTRDTGRETLSARLSTWRQHINSAEQRRPPTTTPPPIPPGDQSGPSPSSTTMRGGFAPTNLDAIARQPKPVIVRSPAASAEPDEQTTPVVRTVPVPPEVPAVEEAEAPPPGDSSPPPDTPSSSPLETINVHTTRTFGSDEDLYTSPLDNPARDVPDVPDEEAAPPPPRPTHRPDSWARAVAAGMTTRGLMVHERQGLSLINNRVPADNPTAVEDPTPEPSPRDALDRDIHALQHRLDETQREWYNAWDLERSSAIIHSRVPNQYSTVRADAMRRHVENSHRLWTLMSRRAQQYGPPEPLDANGQRRPVAAMRHILLTSPSFLRPPGYYRPRPPRRANAPSLLEPQPSSPADESAVQDMERVWIQRIQRERAGDPLERSPDQFEYEYYRDFIYDDRRRRHAVPTTGLPPNAPESSASSSSATDDTEDSWPARRLELLGGLVRTQSRPEVAPTLPPVHRPTRLETLLGRDGPAPGSLPSAPQEEYWVAHRRQLLEFIEQSRGRVHEMARELSPHVLAEERPGMRRVLMGIERMLATPDMPLDMRTRFERLAQRERDVLREVDAAARVESARPAVERQRPAMVLERIERTRARVRELSRLHDDLATVRAGIGLGRPMSRRASDADTVVPSTFTVGDLEFDVDIPPLSPMTPPSLLPEFSERRLPPIPPLPARLMQDNAPERVDTPTDVAAERSPAAPDLAELELPPTQPASPSVSEPLSLEPSVAESSTSSSDSHRATSSHIIEESNATATKETGELGADSWPVPRTTTARRPPRPYVSLLDL